MGGPGIDIHDNGDVVSVGWVGWGRPDLWFRIEEGMTAQEIYKDLREGWEEFLKEWEE
jgi:hypothetical protein